MQLITEDQMVALLAAVLQLPVLDLVRLKITPDLIQLIPEELANKLKMLNAYG